MTKFDELLDEAVEVERELRTGERNMKLTPQAFLARAMEEAKCTPGRLDALAETLQEPGSDAVGALVRYVSRQYREPNFRQPFPREQFDKANRVYGRPELQGELGVIGYTVGEALALAARQAVEQWPEAFGPVEDWDQHQARLAELRERRRHLLAEMEEGVTGADLTLKDHAPRFRRHPSVSLDPGWPEHLIEAALRTGIEKAA